LFQCLINFVLHILQCVSNQTYSKAQKGFPLQSRPAGRQA
jgi:hypothetical protein